MEEENVVVRRRHGAQFDSAGGSVRREVVEGTLIGNGGGGTYEHDHWINCSGCACISLVGGIALIILALIIGAVALSSAGVHSQTLVYKQSGALHNSPMGQTLNGNGAPLAMTLPTDLSDFKDITYTITSSDAAAHTVTITAGTLTTTFDGGNTIATFDGAQGSTMVYRIVAADRIHVVSTFGVTLS